MMEVVVVKIPGGSVRDERVLLHDVGDDSSNVLTLHVHRASYQLSTLVLQCSVLLCLL